MTPIPFSEIGTGFGTMSMCITDDRPSRSEAVRMIEEAVEHGLSFIDTANCYALDGSVFGYGDELVRPFMDREGVTVATKGGMTRTGKAWGSRGDPKYLREMCDASMKRLGTNSIDLYQFHTPDPNVPYAESIGELVRLRGEGKIKNIGVSNVELAELKIAKEMADVCSVQNPLSIIYYQPNEHEGCSKAKLPASNESFWRLKISKNIERDKFVKRELTKLGWKVYVIWGCELSDLKKLQRTVAQIKKRI